MTPLAAITAAIALSGALAVWSHETARRPLHWLTKPLTTALIALAVWRLPTLLPAGAQAWLLAALGLSWLGDVCLMFKPRLFVAGLVAFLLAHVAFIACFATAQPLGLVTLVALVPAALYGGLVLRQLWPHLGRHRRIVLLYVVALTGVVALLLGRFVSAPTAVHALGALGGFTFALADTTLAYRVFAGRAWPYAVELGAYFAAQWLIVSSTLAL